MTDDTRAPGTPPIVAPAEPPIARGATTHRRPLHLLEPILLAAGLLAAAGAGIVAYEVVGVYGDGPFAGGYRHIVEPKSGRSLLIHESQTPSGLVWRVIDRRKVIEVGLDTDADGREDTRAHLTGRTITRIDRDTDGDGRADVWDDIDADGRLVRTGFSMRRDSVIDAWAYSDDNGQLARIDVSTRRDGVIDRWEHYVNGQVARVEEDTDRDGFADRWSLYQDGILTTVTNRPHRGGLHAPTP